MKEPKHGDGERRAGRGRAVSPARSVPILSWLPAHDRSWLRLDVIAGLTLWGLVVPNTPFGVEKAEGNTVEPLVGIVCEPPEAGPTVQDR
jgi:hypothetical protein